MKKTNQTAAPRLAQKKAVRTAGKVRWHAFGLGRELPHRDPAALTFARLGLLATRW